MISKSFEDIVGSIVRAEIEGALRRMGAANTQTSDELLTVSAAALLAKVSVGTVRNWLRRGLLTRYGNGRRLLRISRKELLELLASNRDDGEPGPEERARRVLGR